MTCSIGKIKLQYTILGTKPQRAYKSFDHMYMWSWKSHRPEHSGKILSLKKWNIEVNY